MSSGSSSSRNKAGRRATPERVTLGVAVLLLASLLITLVYQKVQRGDSPAAMSIDAGFSAAFEREGQWYLPVRVMNIGDEPTDTVRVEVEQQVAGAEPEVSELEFAFVSGGEEVSGWAVLDAEPSRENVTASVVSITDP